MHLVLGMNGGRADGQLWLGGIEASGRVDVLVENGIRQLAPAAGNPPVCRDSRIHCLGLMDGTGIIRGSYPWHQILAFVRKIADALRAGHKVLISCRNGAHRSSTLTALVLMFLTGACADSVNAYLKLLRTVVDLESYHPGHRRPVLQRDGHWRQEAEFSGTPLEWLRSVEKEVHQDGERYLQGFSTTLNQVVTPRQFFEMALGAGYTHLFGVSWMLCSNVLASILVCSSLQL